MNLLCKGQKILFTGPTALFMHLKFILLQYFQFSVSVRNSMHLNRICILTFAFSFFFFLLRPTIYVGHTALNGPHALCAGPTTSLTSKYFIRMCHTSGSRALFTGPTNLFFINFFIKNEFYGTIHIYKIILLQYFQFLVLIKINSIQMDHKRFYPLSLKSHSLENASTLLFLYIS